MGSSLSIAEQSLVEDEQTPLMRLSGDKPISKDDVGFWMEELDSVRFALRDLDLVGLRTVVSIVSHRMVSNHDKSRNLLSLMQLITSHLRQLTSETRMVPPRLTNWLFLARMLIKHVIETQNRERIREIFEWERPGEHWCLQSLGLP